MLIRRHGVKAKRHYHVEFWMLEHLGIISSDACSGFLMGLQDVHLSAYVENAEKL